MKKLLAVLLCLGLVGCATAGKINSLSIGMTKEDVIKRMGTPVSTSAENGVEFLNYQLAETNDQAFNGFTTPYAVVLRDGKVASFGRHGDFGTTEQAAQVIKLISDVKTDEKVNIKMGNGDLESKLKTLNKLLSDKLITQNEFDEQKKRLLNDYTIK